MGWVSVGTSAGAYAAFFVIFSALWAPVYLAGADGILFLFPLALVALVPVLVLALGATVTGAIAWSSDRARIQRASPVAILGAVSGLVLLVLALPVLWFGISPLALIAG
jgi:hypothetical protein